MVNRSVILAQALCIAVLAGCASAPKAPLISQPGVAISPQSSQTSPLHLTQPGGTVTLTASEAGYRGGFSASIFTGEHCVDLTPRQVTTDQFVVTRVLGCNRVLIEIVDDVGNSASAYLVTQ